MINKQQALTLASLILGGFGLGGISAAIHGFATPEPVKLTKSEPPKIEEKPNPLTSPSPTPSPSIPTNITQDEEPKDEVETEEVKPIKTKIINSTQVEPPIKRTIKTETTRRRVTRENENQEVVVKRKRRVRIEPEVEKQTAIAPKIITKNYNRRNSINNNEEQQQEPRVRKRRRIVETEVQQPKVEKRQNNRRLKRSEDSEIKKTIEQTPIKRRQRDLDDEPKVEKRNVNQANNNKPEVEKIEGRTQNTEQQLKTKEPITEIPQEIEQEQE